MRIYLLPWPCTWRATVAGLVYHPCYPAGKNLLRKLKPLVVVVVVVKDGDKNIRFFIKTKSYNVGDRQPKKQKDE